MPRILLTGMSGVGKSTVLTELAARGHRTVDTDYDGWSEEVPTPDGVGVEQRWHEGRMSTLLAGNAAGTLFVAGCVSNQGRFYDRFEAVVLLSAPLPVMLDRIARRTTNPFGRTAEERDRIVADVAAVEPMLRRTCTVEVLTDRPLDLVVAAVEATAATD